MSDPVNGWRHPILKGRDPKTKLLSCSHLVFSLFDGSQIWGEDCWSFWHHLKHTRLQTGLQPFPSFVCIFFICWLTVAALKDIRRLQSFIAHDLHSVTYHSECVSACVCVWVILTLLYSECVSHTSKSNQLLKFLTTSNSFFSFLRGCWLIVWAELVLITQETVVPHLCSSFVILLNQPLLGSKPRRLSH